MANTLRGLHTVRVETIALIGMIRDNMAAHKAEYEQAIAGFWDEFHDLVSKAADETREDARKLAEKAVYLKRPESHVDDYERALAMLEASLDDELEITSDQFNCYWLDQWRWKEDFSSTAALYNNR